MRHGGSLEFWYCRRYMQKIIFFLVIFIFLRKFFCCCFFCIFSTFYSQRSVTAAWATRSPWSIFWVNYIFLRKKGDFSDVFSAFYGQRSVTAALATRSPWSISLSFFLLLCLLLFTHFGDTPDAEIPPPSYSINHFFFI